MGKTERREPPFLSPVPSPTPSQSFRVLGMRRSRWRNCGERSHCTHFIENFASLKVRTISAIEILQYRVYCKAVDWTNLSLFCRRSAQWYSYLIPHFSHPQINDIHSFRNRVNSVDEILLLYPFNVSFASVLRFSARSGVTLVELTSACVQHKKSLGAYTTLTTTKDQISHWLNFSGFT